MAARVAITPEQIEELAKLLSLSASLDPACLLAGIARRSCCRYLRVVWTSCGWGWARKYKAQRVKSLVG